MNLLYSLLVSFFLISSCYADDNPLLGGYPPKQIMGFRGLDTKSTAPLIQDSRARDLLNVKLSSSYNLQKRYGIDTVNDKSLDDKDTDSPAVTGIFDAEYSNGNSWTLVFVGAKLKYDNSGTWTNVSGNGSVTDGQNQQWGCVMALDNAICTNGTDFPLQINSTPTKSPVSFSGLSNDIAKAEAVVWFRNYLIFGNTTEGGTARPTRIRWSNVGTINTWTTADFVDIASFSGDEITGFVEMYGDLYIFLRKSIWKASLVGGNDIFTFTKVVDGIGAVAKGSIQLVNLPEDRLGVIFLDENKRIYLFNGVVATDIGRVIQPTLDDLLSSRLEFAESIYDGFDYHLSVTTGSGSTNNIVFVFQTEIGEWTRYDNIDANAFARVKDTNNVVKTYYGNYKALVYWMDNPSNLSDVDGKVGVIDSVSTHAPPTGTAMQILIDSGLADSNWTGATIKITSGTGVGEEQVILTALSTGVVVATAFTTTPDSTSNYTIGAIDAYYNTKWYDFADATRTKSFKEVIFWASEEENNEVILHYYEDFGSEIDQETISLAPSSSSVWDTAVWDTATWAEPGDKVYEQNLTGKGRNIQLEFDQPNIDKTFNIYGFHLKAEGLDER